MFTDNVGRESNYKTTISFNGAEIVVDWTALEDIKIPEKRLYVDRAITSVNPEKYYRIMGEELILQLCDRAERKKNGT